MGLLEIRVFWFLSYSSIIIPTLCIVCSNYVSIRKPLWFSATRCVVLENKLKRLNI